ncbi:MAG TPA: U32 family peptidase [Phenylobacterium sp.]|nr:U32 family peptidase [Phenylobacterium sp.]
MELCLGPLLFNWPAPEVDRFYGAVARNPHVQRVYLGEVVCGKRAPLLAEVLAGAAARLADAGKTVVWSSLALPSTPRERKLGRALAETPDLIEVNDLSILAERAHDAPFVAGPLLNVYNEATARELVARGCVRLCANVELPLSSVGQVASACPGLELELFAFGRLPLALSGRCHHARAHGRHKDTCLFVCDQDPDGMAVKTVEGAPFLAINGVQTLSHGVQLVDLPVAALQDAGIGALRLSPHTGDMAAVIAAFRRFIDGEIPPGALRTAVEAAGPPGALVSGYLHGAAGLRPTGSA